MDSGYGVEIYKREKRREGKSFGENQGVHHFLHYVMFLFVFQLTQSWLCYQATGQKEEGTTQLHSKYMKKLKAPG